MENKILRAYGIRKFWFYTVVFITSVIIATYSATNLPNNAIVPLVILSIFYIIITFLSFVRYKRIAIQCKGIKEYCSMLYFERPDKFIWMFYKLPKRKSIIFAIWGNIFAIVLPSLFITSSGITIIHRNWSIWYHNNIARYLAAFSPGGPWSAMSIVLAIMIIMAIFSPIIWFASEYSFNKFAQTAHAQSL